MSTATLTSKGQITIPKTIRERLRLKVGHKINFVFSSNGEVVMSPACKSVESIFGILERKGQKPKTVEEINSAIGRALEKVYR